MAPQSTFYDLEVVVQTEGGSSGSKAEAEALFTIEAAFVIANKGETEGSGPVFGGHPSDTGLQTDSVAEVIAQHVEVASQIEEHTEFLDAANAVADIRRQDEGLGGRGKVTDELYVLEAIVGANGDGPRSAGEAVSNFRGNLESRQFLVEGSTGRTTNPNLSVCTENANEGKS